MSTMEPEAAEEGVGSSLEILLEVATPEIYQQNAFRILGLLVDVTARDMARHAERLQIRERLGSGVPAAEGIFPLNPAPGVDMIREAMQRLRDPERRLVDEFFWFWPAHFGESHTDPALMALAGGDIQAAVDIWRAQEQAGDESAVAVHNLAILAHVAALEPKTAELIRPSFKGLVLRLDVYWQQEIFQRWKRLHEDNAFWNQVATRIRDFSTGQISNPF